jgi:membrane protein implicated in regulation of membrane protease activity
MNLFSHVEGYASNSIGAVKTIFSIMKLEAKLASLSVLPLLLNLCTLFVVLITVWFSAMVFLSYGIFLASGYVWVALSAILLLNLILCVLLFRYLKYNLKSMSFEKTREYFSTGKTHYARIKKTAHGENHKVRKRIKSSAR